MVAILYMLCYACSKQLYLFQAAIDYLLFMYNVFKQYIKIFYQLGIIVIYKSIRQSLNSNAFIVKKAFLNKTSKKRFFISYDNINFYKEAKDQKLHNKATFISYIANYVYFMNILGSLINGDNNWYKR